MSTHDPLEEPGPYEAKPLMEKDSALGDGSRASELPKLRFELPDEAPLPGTTGRATEVESTASPRALNPTDKELFVRLLANHERRVYAYILSLVPNWADADEIFQETNIRLWRDFAQFDRGTNFGAWATTVAFYQVLTWRKRVSRNRLVFDNEMIDAIAQRHEQLMPLAESRFRALRECVAELSQRHRELLARCYAPGIAIKDVAKASGRTQASVYKALQRIRGALRSCIERRMSREQAS